jgi:putative CocE/NonD family hydrolase
MKKILTIAFIFSFLQLSLSAQHDSIFYKKASVTIPMRDGIKLYTVILTPINASTDAPILMQRTPYGANRSLPDDSVFTISNNFPYANMARDGYIFVFQDVRGKFNSEGTMQIHQPLIHATQKDKVDESTDTYDSVDWLIKNVPGNNGKAGIVGISYPGWLALVGAVDPHPALKASSEQACMADLFLGDDFHHNGAFRLSYGMEYTYGVESEKTRNGFPFPQFDLYDWYLNLGSLKNMNDKYFHNNIPTWNHFVQHPNYDSFWKQNSTLSYIQYPQIPMLHVGGYYDQEDLNGPQLMYAHMEKKDTFNRNFIVLGPWNHGQWASGNADSLGKINFESKTGPYFRELQKKWFDYWLRGIGDGKFDEATCFQTGNNHWKIYGKWPPQQASVKNLYATSGNRCSFTKPTSADSFVSYISDPSKPVPYRIPPIEATYGSGSRWRSWHVEDQRFVYSRPDVVSFTSDSLTKDLIVTGKIIAHLFASTSGTDADWVVKLIDVYPDLDKDNLLMSQYQLPVAMEVFRGRFRKSFEKPEALIPNKPEEFVIDLHEINHAFKKGHKIMVQIQSSWFPVIDRNPQKFVRNIFEAKESDYIKATQKIYFSAQNPTHIELPVISE